MESHNLSCAICLERFRIPVTIPCGHTFCRDCITAHWDTKSKLAIGPHCPVCNEEFPGRPVLKRNVSLSLLGEATACGAGAAGRDSIPVTIGESGRSKPLVLCERHGKPQVYFCKQDNACVCYECAVNECRNHEMVLVEVEREEREMVLRRKSVEVGKLMEETERGIAELTENIGKAKVTLDQTSLWVDAKFSMLLKVISEKHESTKGFVERQREATLSQAEARLAALQERDQQLRERQVQIATLRDLPDSQLIQDSRLVEVPRLPEVPVDVTPNLQERLNGVTDILSRISKLVSEDLDKAVCTAVGQDKQGDLA